MFTCMKKEYTIAGVRQSDLTIHAIFQNVNEQELEIFKEEIIDANRRSDEWTEDDGSDPEMSDYHDNALFSRSRFRGFQYGTLVNKTKEFKTLLVMEQIQFEI
jgi:hypothetical protein